MKPVKVEVEEEEVEVVVEKPAEKPVEKKSSTKKPAKGASAKGKAGKWVCGHVEAWHKREGGCVVIRSGGW